MIVYASPKKLLVFSCLLECRTNMLISQGEGFDVYGIFGGGYYFDGVYNGGNHSIYNIYTSDRHNSTKENNGLFGVLDGAVINLGIGSGTIPGDCVGAIANHGGDHSVIINCYNMANIIGNYRAGGICDNLNSGKVICCVNVGNVAGKEFTAQIVSYE